LGIRYSGGRAVSEDGRSYTSSGGRTSKVVVMGKEYTVNISQGSRLTGSGVTAGLVSIVKQQEAQKQQEANQTAAFDEIISRQKKASLEMPSPVPKSFSQDIKPVFQYGQQSRSSVDIQTPSSFDASVSKPVYQFGEQSRSYIANHVTDSKTSSKTTPISTGFEPSGLAENQKISNVKKGRSQAQIRADVARIKQERLEASFEGKGREALSPTGFFGKKFKAISEKLVPGYVKSQSQFFKSQGKIIALAEEKEQDFANRLARIEGRRQSNKLESERIAAQQRLESTAKILGEGVSSGIVSLESAEGLLKSEHEKETFLLKEKVKPIEAEVKSFVGGALEERQAGVEAKLTKDLSAATFTGSPVFGLDEFVVGKVPILQKGIKGLSKVIGQTKQAQSFTPEKTFQQNIMRIEKSNSPFDKTLKNIATIQLGVEGSTKALAVPARMATGLVRGVIRRPATTSMVFASGYVLGGASKLLIPSIKVGGKIALLGKATKVGLGGLFIGGTTLRAVTATDFDEGVSRIGESFAFAGAAVGGAKLGSATVSKIQTSFGTTKITSKITEFQPKQVIKQRSKIVKATRTNLQKAGLSDVEFKRRLIPSQQKIGQQVSIRKVEGQIAGFGKIKKGFLVSTGKTTVGSFNVPKQDLNVIVKATKGKTVLSVRQASSGKLIRKITTPTPKGLKISSMTIQDFNIKRVLTDLPGNLKLQKVKGVSIDVTKKGKSFLTQETQRTKIFRSSEQQVMAKLRTTKTQPGTKTVKIGSARLTNKGLKFESTTPKDVSKLELTKIKIGTTEKLPSQLQRSEILRSGELKIVSINPRKLITQVDVFSRGRGIEEIFVVGKGKQALNVLGRSFVRGIKAPAYLISGVGGTSTSSGVMPSGISTSSSSSGISVLEPSLEFPLPSTSIGTSVSNINSNLFNIPFKQGSVLFPVLIGEPPIVKLKSESRISFNTNFGSLISPKIEEGISTKPSSLIVPNIISGSSHISKIDSIFSPDIIVEPIVEPILDIGLPEPNVSIPGFGFGGIPSFAFPPIPIIPFGFIPPFDPISGGGGGKFNLRKVLSRQTKYQASIGASEKIFVKAFKKSAATKKSRFVTGVEIRL